MKRGLLLLVLITGCSQLPERPASLTESLPHVISILPEEEEVLFSQSEFRLMISEPLDEATATPNAVFLLEGELPSSVPGDTKALFRSLEKDEVVSLPIRIDLIDSGQTLSLQTESELKPDTRYTVVLTPRLLSKGRLSVTYFSKEYNTLSSSEIDVARPVVDNGQPSPENGTPISAEESPSGLPETPQGEIAQNSAPEGFVVINEIFYDAVGSDLNGLVFIELFGTPGFPIGGYQIHFVNGEDGKLTDSITLPEEARVRGDGFYLIADAKTGSPGETQVAQTDLIDEFDPQNGPDAIQLLNPNGDLVDVIGYGEGLRSVSEDGIDMFESSVAPDVVSGHSLERVSPGQDTDNNAADFLEREVPSPGQ